jgi:hypothetical protein
MIRQLRDKQKNLQHLQIGWGSSWDSMGYVPFSKF